MSETSNEALCPHCGTRIYKGFVTINHYCPSCGTPVEAEKLLPCREEAKKAAVAQTKTA